MISSWRVRGVAMAAVVWTAAPVTAHHAFAAQYDIQKPVEVRGAVSKIEWTNPHARIYIDVKEAGGQTLTWNFEMASPNVLIRNGWKPSSVTVGDQIVVSGYLARKGDRMAIAGAVADKDGRPLFASTQADLGR
jgi:hypothetical protein